MQEYLQTADAGDTLSDSGCMSLSIRKRMLETLNQTSVAGVSLSDSGCRRLSIRQRMQDTLYQTAGAGDSVQSLIETLLHPLSDRESPASTV